MNSSMPSAAYSSMRSATSSWLPTMAVPAPPRNSPMPAHSPGWISRSLGSPVLRYLACSVSCRAWPTDSLTVMTCCMAAISSGSTVESRRAASAQASADRSLAITCTRIPKRSDRPSSAAACLTLASFSLTSAGGSPHVR
jgi:hypothetical protein